LSSSPTHNSGHTWQCNAHRGAFPGLDELSCMYHKIFQHVALHQVQRDVLIPLDWSQPPFQDHFGIQLRRAAKWQRTTKIPQLYVEYLRWEILDSRLPWRTRRKSRRKPTAQWDFWASCKQTALPRAPNRMFFFLNMLLNMIQTRRIIRMSGNNLGYQRRYPPGIRNHQATRLLHIQSQKSSRTRNSPYVYVCIYILVTFVIK
jgi:hypothetical protein